MKPPGGCRVSPREPFRPLLARVHQLNWIDDLCDAVLDVAETRFYRGIAKMTRGFVHMETEVIADELEALQGLADKQAA